MKEAILVTGSSGFIGYHLCNKLLNDGYTVIGVDNHTGFYDASLKEQRLNMLRKNNFHFYKNSINDTTKVTKIFQRHHPTIVINLAAKTGVRHSTKYSKDYLETNINGFMNILEISQKNQVKHFIYASSSSVYGNSNDAMSESFPCNKPISIYAATKKSDELIAHAYSSLFNMPTTGLRFFTTYGPFGRPDMAYFDFTTKLLQGSDIQLYANGTLKRDFVYIDDLTTAIYKVIKAKPKTNYNIYNIGKGTSNTTSELISTIEQSIIRHGLLPKDHDFSKNIKSFPTAKTDTEATYADITKFVQDFHYKPTTPLPSGIDSFIKWYKTYYL